MIDTSCFVRFFIADDIYSDIVKAALSKLVVQGAGLHFTPQVARESWGVITRPKDVVGYGLSPELTEGVVERAHRVFEFLPDTPNVYGIWRRLVTEREVSGKQVHDAYHVAAMLAHGLGHVLTLDDRDFKRYSEITPIHPNEV